MLSHSRWGAGCGYYFGKKGPEVTFTYSRFIFRERGFPDSQRCRHFSKTIGWDGENWWCHPVRKQDETFIYSIYLFSQPHARVCDSHVIANHVNKRLCSVQLRLLRFPRGSLFSISGSLSTTCISCVGFEWITLCVFKQLIDLRQRRVSLSVQHFNPRTLCFFICRKVCETETDVTTNTQRLWSSLNYCTWSQMLEVLSKYEILRVGANSLRLAQTSEQRHLLLRRGTSLSLCLSAGSLDYSNTWI